MKSTFVLALFAVVGCGGGGSSSSKDMAVAVANHDLAATSSACDVAAQDCGGTGLKCVATVDSMGNIVAGICVPDGTVAEGQPCALTPMDTTDFNDNCKKGLTCDTFNVLNATPLCRTLCTVDTGCPASQRCADLTAGTADWGQCLPTCASPAAANTCGAGADCGDSWDDFADETDNTGNGFFICKTTGTGAYFDSCTDDSSCGAGLWCDQQNGFCVGNCKTDADCPAPAADGGASGLTGTCGPYDDTPDNFGPCFYM